MENKTLIIYDLNGSIIGSPIKGFYDVPNGIPYIEVIIPEGKYAVSVNVETQEPILEDIPKPEIDLLSDKISILEDSKVTQTIAIANLESSQLSQDDGIMQSMMGTAEVCEMVIMLQEQIDAMSPNPVALNINNKLGGNSAMVEVYANLVLAGKYTCEPSEAINGVKLVPSIYREQVKAKLVEWAK